MSWDTVEKLLSNVWVPLQDDGDTVVVTFCGEPYPLQVESFGQSRLRIAFPVVYDGEFRVFGASKTVAREMAGRWDELTAGSVRITRHGAANSMKTTYTFDPIDADPSDASTAKGFTDSNFRELADKSVQSPSVRFAEDAPPF